MFRDDVNTLLMVAFILILIPSTGLLVRYTWFTRFWDVPVGRAFFLILSTTWFNYVITAVSIQWPEWAEHSTGVSLRTAARLCIAAALVYAWWVYEKARRAGRHEQDGFAKPPRTPEGGIERQDVGN